MKIKFLPLAFFLSICFFNIAAFAEEDSYYSQHAKGWHWYDDPVPVKENESENSMASDPVQQMNAVKATIQRALDKAVINPSEQNIKEYLALQNELMTHSGKFSKLWKKVLLEEPQLDYSLIHPTNNIARQIESDAENKNEEIAIQALAKRSGLFFFYRSSCPYCVRFAPIVKAFAKRYGITVIPITTDGVSLPEFPNSYIDQGQVQTFNVKAEPALFAVNPYSKEAYPVSFGFMSEMDLKKRILDIATRFEGMSK